MAEQFTDANVRHVAKLARLHLDDQQIRLYRDQLATVLEHVQKLGELDLDGVEPLSHPIDLTNNLADDVVQPSMPIDDAMRNAPQVEGPFIAVPKVLADSGGG